MLKKFYERDATDKPASVVQSVIVDNSDPVGSNDLVFFDPHGSKSFHICEDLSEQQIHEISTLIKKYPDVFSDKPGKTNQLSMLLDWLLIYLFTRNLILCLKA